jgi:hypothetical protein
LFTLASCNKEMSIYYAANAMPDGVARAKDNRTYCDNAIIINLLKQYMVNTQYLANAKGTPVISWNKNHEQYELKEDHTGTY